MAIFLSFIYGVALFYFSLFFLYTGFTLSFFLLLFIFLNRYSTSSLRLSHIALVVILSMSGYAYAKLSYSHQTSPLELQGTQAELKGFLKSEKLTYTRSGSVFLQNINIIEAFDSTGNRLFIKEINVLNENRLEKDKIYSLKGRFSREGYYLNPGFRANLPAFYVLTATETGRHEDNFFEKMRAKLNSFMRESFSDSSSAFLLSITTGERIFLGAEMRNAFSITGLAHILSISGAHFGLLFVILFGCFRMAFKYLPYNLLARLTIYFTPSQIAAVMTFPFLIFYLGISSLSIPSIRAFIMITLFLAGLLMGRKGLWLNTLVIAAFIVVLLSPDAIIDISFQLSFAAVLCIGLITDRLKHDHIQEDIPNKEVRKSRVSSAFSFFCEYLKYSFLISLAATAGTAPLVAYYFHYFSAISPLTNLLFTPLIGFIILPAALLSSLIYLAFGVFPFISLLDNFTLFVLDIIQEIARWNFVDIKIPAFPLFLLFSFYAGLLLFAGIKHKKPEKDERSMISLYFASAVIALLPFLIYAVVKFNQPETLKVTFLDVGQGDAAVAEFSDDSVLVIDTGKSGYQVAQYLKYRGIRNIDAIAVSHMHTDHSGGVEYLLDNFNVSEIWIGSTEPAITLAERKFSYRRLQRGDILGGNGYRIYVLHPYDEFYTRSDKNDGNNYSMVIKIVGHRNSFLFTGDIEKEAQEDLVNLKLHLKSNVLKVPHHGSKSSSDEFFYSLVSPEIAIISAGRKNLSGHPHVDTLGMLHKATVLRTDIDGAVKVEEMPDGSMKIKTFREFQFKEVISLSDEISNVKKLFSVW